MSLSIGRSEKVSSPRRAERRNSPELSAYHWNGSVPQQDPIRDISSTGAFLVTHKRWEPGELISLTLQRKGPFEKSPEHRILVQARAVRWEENGVAVSFVLPAGADLRLWQSPLKSSADQSEPEDILREFRVAHAIAFLSRIAPDASNEIAKLLHEGLSNYRLEHAIEIANKAERFLEGRPDGDKMRAPAQYILRILESGSWVEDPYILQLWAGLMASSCSSEQWDDSSVSYIELMSQLNAVHIRILAGACTKASKIITGPDRISSRPLAYSASDLMKISGSHDLIRIERDLLHLAELGLIERREKGTFFLQISDAKVTPTFLGLELYARCNGHRVTKKFYGLASYSASSHSDEGNRSDVDSVPIWETFRRRNR
jgi:hypothetical protein